MKNLTLSILFVFSLFACKKDFLSHQTHILQNNSNQRIEVKDYDYKSFLILPNQSEKIQHSYRGGGYIRMSGLLENSISNYFQYPHYYNNL